MCVCGGGGGVALESGGFWSLQASFLVARFRPSGFSGWLWAQGFGILVCFLSQGIVENLIRQLSMPGDNDSASSSSEISSWC